MLDRQAPARESSHHPISQPLAKAPTINNRAPCRASPRPLTVSAATPMRQDSARLSSGLRMERRRRHLLRVDVGFGLLAAVAAFLIAPGLEIVAVAALSALGVCLVSLAIARRRSR